MAAKTQGEEKMYVVITEFKEVFCGFSSDVSGDRIKLRNARQAVYWSQETHGLLGLAINGPAKGSRIGPPANMEVRKVVNVVECSQAAIAVWEGAKWV